MTQTGWWHLANNDLVWQVNNNIIAKRIFQKLDLSKKCHGTSPQQLNGHPSLWTEECSPYGEVVE